jgi:hypothetical protein
MVDRLNHTVFVPTVGGVVCAEGCLLKCEVVDAFGGDSDLRREVLIDGDQRGYAVADEGGVSRCLGETFCPEFGRASLGTVSDRIRLADLKASLTGIAYGVEYFLLTRLNLLIASAGDARSLMELECCAADLHQVDIGALLRCCGSLPVP